jgi:polar amino acid transport system substrate-binding protein
MEIFGGNKIGVINDFKGGEFYSGNKLKMLKDEGKGHKEEINAFFDALSRVE